MSSEKNNWFATVFRWRGSIIPRILPQVLLCGLLGIFVSALEFFHYAVSWPVLASIVPNVVLGLLLVFRTNTAYERFWEGRKHWGTLVVSVRNLSRQIWVAVKERDINDKAAKVRALKLLVAFTVATKLHLRSQRPNDELRSLLSECEFSELEAVHMPPIEIALWLGAFLQDQYDDGRLNPYQLSAMHRHLDSLTEALGASERILRTPIPMAYAIHLKQLLFIYCLVLPFQFVGSLYWWTGPTTALVSFTLLGIEAIGIEIENPFGTDPNDLPLDEICDTMRRNIKDLIEAPVERLRPGQNLRAEDLSMLHPPWLEGSPTVGG